MKKIICILAVIAVTCFLIICSWTAVIEVIFKGLIYLSLMCPFVILIWWWQEDDIFFFSMEGLKKVVRSLLFLAISFVVFLLSAHGRSYFEQPMVNKLIYSHGYFLYCDTIKKCNSSESSFYTIKTTDKEYNPSRKDTCIHCKNLYWKHRRKDEIDPSLRLSPDPFPI